MTNTLWYHHLFKVNTTNYGSFHSIFDPCSQGHCTPCSDELDSKGLIEMKSKSWGWLALQDQQYLNKVKNATKKDSV